MTIARVLFGLGAVYKGFGAVRSEQDRNCGFANGSSPVAKIRPCNRDGSAGLPCPGFLTCPRWLTPWRGYSQKDRWRGSGTGSGRNFSQSQI